MFIDKEDYADAEFLVKIHVKEHEKHPDHEVKGEILSAIRLSGKIKVIVIVLILLVFIVFVVLFGVRLALKLVNGGIILV